MPPGRATSEYRADIDGLRAIAVTSVVLFHAGAPPFWSGFVGVDIFFVISGYLIGGMILRDVADRQFNFALFYARRARRILPALITVVLASCLAGWFLLSPAQFRDLGATAVTALLGVSNISFYKFTDYFFIDSRLHLLLMTWSLGVEEQFYVVFPIAMLALARTSRRVVAVVLVGIVVASFAASAWATFHAPKAAFYLLPFRAWELGVGVLLALGEQTGGPAAWGFGRFARTAWVQPALGALGLALVVASVCVFDGDTRFPGFAAVLPVAGAATLIGARSSGVNRRMLSWPPFVFVGRVSYSWYLWHWPLMSLVHNLAFNDPPLWVMLATALVAFAMAVASWRFIEQPFRRGAFRPRPILLGYAAALMAALIVPFSVKLGQGFPWHVSPLAQQIETIRTRVVDNPCLAGLGADRPNLSAACVQARDGRPTVTLIGDSHAAALAPGLRALATEQGWGYEILTKSSCRPFVGVTDWRRDTPQQSANCAAFMKTAFARAASDPKSGTVILAGMWPLTDSDTPAEYEHFAALPPYGGSTRNTDLFRFGLQQAVALLAAAGKNVIVVGDTPRWRFDIGQVALTKAIPLRHKLAALLWTGAPHDFPDEPGRELVYTRSERNDEFFRSLARHPAVAYVDLFPRFCSDRSCVFQHDSNILFIDTGHLSEVGARYALEGVSLK